MQSRETFSNTISGMTFPELNFEVGQIASFEAGTAAGLLGCVAASQMSRCRRISNVTKEVRRCRRISNVTEHVRRCRRISNVTEHVRRCRRISNVTKQVRGAEVSVMFRNR